MEFRLTMSLWVDKVRPGKECEASGSGTARMTDYLQPVGESVSHHQHRGLHGCVHYLLTALAPDVDRHDLPALVWLRKKARAWTRRYSCRSHWFCGGIYRMATCSSPGCDQRRHGDAHMVHSTLRHSFLSVLPALVAYQRGSVLFMVEGVFVYLAMIFVGRNMQNNNE